MWACAARKVSVNRTRQPALMAPFILRPARPPMKNAGVATYQPEKHTANCSPGDNWLNTADSAITTVASEAGRQERRARRPRRGALVPVLSDGLPGGVVAPVLPDGVRVPVLSTGDGDAVVEGAGVGPLPVIIMMRQKG